LADLGHIDDNNDQDKELNDLMKKMNNFYDDEDLDDDDALLA